MKTIFIQKGTIIKVINGCPFGIDMRYTEKVKNTDDYIRLATKDKQGFINKLGKLEDLEEALGCPLEIYVKINQLDITTVYDKNGIEHIIAPVTIGASSFFAGKGFESIECRWNMYCKNWWLREDKSE